MTRPLPDELLDRLVRTFDAAREPQRAEHAAAYMRDQFAWSAETDRWLVRTAILHQLHWGTATDAKRLFGYCTRQAGHRDFFVRKAIGWALRHYARTDPDAVRGYLAKNSKILSPLSVREASKHL
jgi:3-methyladenine DNA glycosylase AlkD